MTDHLEPCPHCNCQPDEPPADSRPTIGVIGGGVLGRALARGFIESAAQVKVFDTMPERSTATREEATCSTFVFICLPTPATIQGYADCKPLVEYLSWARDFIRDKHREERKEERHGTGPRPLFVVKSTVPVGWSQMMFEAYDLPLVHSPEFLTARIALTDFQVPARNIIGVPTGADLPETTRLHKWADLLDDFYTSRFPGVPVLRMSSDESELTKLATNSFFATKVAFFNMLREFCAAQGHDFEAVRGGMLSDGRIAHAHTASPGPDGMPGFGGTCLPKDLRSLETSLDEAGVSSSILRAVATENWRQRSPVDPALYAAYGMDRDGEPVKPPAACPSGG